VSQQAAAPPQNFYPRGRMLRYPQKPVDKFVDYLWIASATVDAAREKSVAVKK
jgi:hypothetical protein